MTLCRCGPFLWQHWGHARVPAVPCAEVLLVVLHAAPLHGESSHLGQVASFLWRRLSGSMSVSCHVILLTLLLNADLLLPFTAPYLYFLLTLAVSFCPFCILFVFFTLFFALRILETGFTKHFCTVCKTVLKWKWFLKFKLDVGRTGFQLSLLFFSCTSTLVLQLGSLT